MQIWSLVLHLVRHEWINSTFSHSVSWSSILETPTAAPWSFKWYIYFIFPIRTFLGFCGLSRACCMPGISYTLSERYGTILGRYWLCCIQWSFKKQTLQTKMNSQFIIVLLLDNVDKNRRVPATYFPPYNGSKHCYCLWYVGVCCITLSPAGCITTRRRLDTQTHTHTNLYTCIYVFLRANTKIENERRAWRTPSQKIRTSGQCSYRQCSAASWRL